MIVLARKYFRYYRYYLTAVLATTKEVSLSFDSCEY